MNVEHDFSGLVVAGFALRFAVTRFTDQNTSNTVFLKRLLADILLKVKGEKIVGGTAREIEDHSWFFERVSAAEKRVLLLDYDGTIAPFSADRQRAYPYPGVPELLRDISKACDTRLIVVTGRPAQLIAFFKDWIRACE